MTPGQIQQPNMQQFHNNNIHPPPILTKPRTLPGSNKLMKLKLYLTSSCKRPETMIRSARYC